MGTHGWRLVLGAIAILLLGCWRRGILLPRPGFADPPSKHAEAVFGRRWWVGIGFGALTSLICRWLLAPSVGDLARGSLQPTDVPMPTWLPVQGSVWAAPVVVGVGVGLVMPLIWTRLRLGRTDQRHFRARDADNHGGVDTTWAAAVLGALIIGLGLLERPVLLGCGDEGVSVHGRWPGMVEHHDWSKVIQVQVVAEEQLLPGWWRQRPGLVVWIAGGTRVRVFAGREGERPSSTDIERAIALCRDRTEVVTTSRER